MMILAVLGILASLAGLFALLVLYRDTTVVKMANPMFLIVILVGIMLG